MPLAQVVLGVVENLARLRGVRPRAAVVTGRDRAVVEEVEQASAMLGENDLLLGALDRRRELGRVCVFELAAGLECTASVRWNASSPL
jgi:hypothetical protein